MFFLLNIITEGLLNDPEKIMNIPDATLWYWGYKTIEKQIRFKDEVGRVIFPSLQSLDAHSQDTEKFKPIPFNVPAIDELLKGGIDVCSVTEINGSAGSGKTQLCLHLAFNCRLPVHLGGSNGSVMYLSTDKSMCGKRLLQLERAFKIKYGHLTDLNFMDGIFMAELNKSEDFAEFVEKCLPQYLQVHGNLKLLIIDSLAGIFRIETDYIRRAQKFCEYFDRLNILAQKHKFAILCTNHITAVPEVGEIAALGVTWSSQVTTRINVEKLSSICGVEIGGKEEISRIRKIKIDFSPRLPPKDAQFCITSRGIKNVPENKFLMNS